MILQKYVQTLFNGIIKLNKSFIYRTRICHRYPVGYIIINYLSLLRIKINYIIYLFVTMYLFFNLIIQPTNAGLPLRSNYYCLDFLIK